MNNESYCTHHFLHSNASIADKCIQAGQYCEHSYFNLIQLNYCSLNDLYGITIFIAFLILIFCFYFVANTANKYLAPILGIISEKLNLSQNLAGLTLLALGNQAPDIIVAIISGEDKHEGISMSLATILGGNAVIILLVLPTVILLGNNFDVIPSNYTRDYSVYLIALMIISVLGYFKEIVLWESICFFLLYIAYVALCIFMDRSETQKLLDEESWYLSSDIHTNYEVKLFRDDMCIVGNKENDIDYPVDQGYFDKKTTQSIPRKSNLSQGSVIFSKFHNSVITNYIKWKET